MHRILLREVVIDAPSETFSATSRFWASALSAEVHEIPRHREFTALTAPAALCVVGLQNTGPQGPARIHLDIETDDVEAEVARLIGLGAVRVAEGRTWVVMQDPSGLVFDVVPHESDAFAERSQQVD